MHYTNKKVSLDALRISRLNMEREITEEDIKDLASNIEEFGQIHPITVRPYGNGGHMYEILAGRRRYTALSYLGWEKADVRVVRADDIDAEIISYSENLKTKKPDTIEWDAAVTRLVELYEKKEEAAGTKPYIPAYKSKRKPEKSKEDSNITQLRDKKSQNSKSPKAKVGRPKKARSRVIERVAVDMGVHKKTVQRALKRHADLIPSAARGLELKTITRSQADRLASLSAAQQRAEFPGMVRDTRDARKRRERSAGIKKSKNRTAIISDILSSAFMNFKDTNDKLETALHALEDTNNIPKSLAKIPNINQARITRDLLIALLELLPD